METDPDAQASLTQTVCYGMNNIRLFIILSLTTINMVSTLWMLQVEWGKPFFSMFYYPIWKNDQIAIATEVSSIASILLCNRMTAHSQFCIAILPQQISVCQLSLQGNRANTISVATLLIKFMRFLCFTIMIYQH